MQQEQLQQKTEQADLLSWRADTQQHELITKLSTTAKSINKPTLLSKMQQVSACVYVRSILWGPYGMPCMRLDCCTVTAVRVCVVVLSRTSQHVMPQSFCRNH